MLRPVKPGSSLTIDGLRGFPMTGNYPGQRFRQGVKCACHPLSHQGAGEFSRKFVRNGAASKTPEQVITFVVIVSVREVGHPNAPLIVKGMHRI